MTTNAEGSYSFGLGMGTSYSGLGVNVSQVSKNDMKYFSAGCVSYSSVFGSTCGVGVGWIKTDLFQTDSDKHGLGAYLGVVGRKRGGRSLNSDDEPSYGAGVGYHYFFNGIGRSGANVGFSLVASDTEDDSDHGVILQIGYQF